MIRHVHSIDLHSREGWGVIQPPLLAHKPLTKSPYVKTNYADKLLHETLIHTTPFISFKINRFYSVHG